MIEIVSIILIALGLLILLLEIFVSGFNHNYPKVRKNNGKYAILIPARDESEVIEDLLISIENQTRKIDSRDVYVIVEKITDPTVLICNNHNMNVVLRKDLTLKRKGYALNDAIEDIFNSSIKYDAYFIIDADNVLDSNFILNMEKSINEGYDIGIGYRNCKNGNDSVVSACSALTFSMINEFNNKLKLKDTRTLTVSGTGFYIRGDILEKLGGYPFFTLTEDYELTLYAVLNDLTTTYNKNAKFYDEQPILYKKSIIQRTRWIKGYFEARKKYITDIIKSMTFNDKNFASKFTEIIGVSHYVLMIVGVIFYLVLKFIDIIMFGNVISNMVKLFIFSMLIYLALVMFTIVLLIIEKDSLNLSNRMKLKSLFFNPIFLIGYVRCALIALYNKNLGWEVIEHNRNLKK